MDVFTNVSICIVVAKCITLVHVYTKESTILVVAGKNSFRTTYTASIGNLLNCVSSWVLP